MKFSPEQLVQLACVDFVRVCCPSVRAVASMNGIHFNAKSVRSAGAYMEKMKRLGLVPGELDLQLRWPIKNILFGEIKAKNGRVSDSQDSMLNELARMGFDAFVAYSLDDFVNECRRFHVPMRQMYYAGIGKL